MKISISDEIFSEFPEAGVGYLVAWVDIRAAEPYVEGVKKTLERQMNDIGISGDTMTCHPDVRRWRETFAYMGVKPSKYRSSLEALLRRLFKGEMWCVSNVVDLYNCVSVLNLTPMGAHDLDKLKGGLTLRRGRQGEKFYPLGSGDASIDVDPRQVVYADDEKITCWLWNHRDTREVAVDAETKRAVFLLDRAFETEWRSLEEGLDALEGELRKIGARTIGKGVIGGNIASAEIKI